MTNSVEGSSGARHSEASSCWLRLYVAKGTPNSSRAESNLRSALRETGGADKLPLEIIDVFKDSKRALIDGVIVTPTLIGAGKSGRSVMIGDLTDSLKLAILLQNLV